MNSKINDLFYRVYNSAIPWNILISCPLDTANLLFNHYIIAVSMEHSFIYNNADTTIMYTLHDNVQWSLA
jgi:hypothetical protein